MKKPLRQDRTTVRARRRSGFFDAHHPQRPAFHAQGRLPQFGSKYIRVFDFVKGAHTWDNCEQLSHKAASPTKVGHIPCGARGPAFGKRVD